jgi:hypothetical protein
VGSHKQLDQMQPVRYTIDMVKKAPQSKVKKSDNHRVDYYPNRMGLTVAAIAAITLVILGLIAVYS